MLTLNECRKLVDPKKEKYTDKQLMMKRDLLAIWARVIVKELLNEKSDDEKESGFNGSGVKR
jgi:hypothetical protein